MSNLRKGLAAVIGTIFAFVLFCWVMPPLYHRHLHLSAMKRVQECNGFVATNYTYGLVVGFRYRADPNPAMPFLKNLAGICPPLPFNIQRLPTELEKLREAKGVRILNLNGTAITDDGLAVCEELRELRELSLANTQITDAGLKHLRNCRELRALDLWGTQITSDGLSNLTNLYQLAFLTLTKTAVDDGAVPHLLRVTNLYRLSLGETHLTQRGISQIRGGYNRPIIVQNQ